jgi:hypothetical protein
MAFLADIVVNQPRGKEIHVSADSLSAHKTGQVEDFLAKRTSRKTGRETKRGEARIGLPRFASAASFVYGSTYRNEVKTMFSSECGAPFVVWVIPSAPVPVAMPLQVLRT